MNKIFLMFLFLMLIASCATTKEEKKNENNKSEIPEASSVSSKLEQKRKEKTVQHDYFSNYEKQIMLNDECKYQKLEKITNHINEKSRCSLDEDCKLLECGGSINVKYFNKKDSILEQFYKECFSSDYNPDDGSQAKCSPINEYIAYCSDDGYCGVFDVNVAYIKETSYIDSEGNKVDEIIRTDNGEKTKTTYFKDKSVRVEISYGNVKKTIITGADGKTIKYEECVNEKCVDKTEEFQKYDDIFLE